MDALIDAIRYEGLDAEIVVVASNKQSQALERAKGFGIRTEFVSQKDMSKVEYDHALYSVLKPYSPDLILLVGYMRFLTKWFVEQFPNKIINIHPSLLPEFAGGMDMEVHEKVLKSGKKISGATLHFVDETPDGGPIIFQKQVEVSEDETLETLKEKVQAVEQELLVKAIGLFCEGKIRTMGNKVAIEGEPMLQ